MAPSCRAFETASESLARFGRGLLLVPWLLVLFTVNLYAQNFLYTNNNLTSAPNTVTAYSVTANGTLTEIATYLTGGSGPPGTIAVPSNNVTACVAGNFLYVANQGSDTVSAFSINPITGTLTAVAGSPFATGGTFNFGGVRGAYLACTPDGRFLMVGNFGSSNITVFGIAANGALSAIGGSPFPIGDLPIGMKVTPNGSFLAVALNSGNVGVFQIAANGALSAVMGSPFLNSSGADVAINAAGNRLFVANTVNNVTSVSVFSIASNGALTPITGSPFSFADAGGGNSVNLVLSPDERFLFVSNFTSKVIAVLNVAADGSLSQTLPGSPFANPAGIRGAGIATNQAGTLLFGAGIRSNNISVFSIGANGTLTSVAGSPFPGHPTLADSRMTSLVVYERSLSPTNGPGLPFPAAAQVSDQKAGSVLFYNLYTSNPADLDHQNTRINLTNTDPSRFITVHLFFVDGSSCAPADAFVCLTPNQTLSFLASDFDPGTTGYIVAMAVDANGIPVAANSLIGDEYVKLQSGHAANLGAEAFAAQVNNPAVLSADGLTAEVRFNNLNYNAVPRVLAVDNFPSTADGNNTLVVLNRLGGDLSTGASTIGSLFGVLFDESEQPFSFTLSSNTCQFRFSLTNSSLRLVQRLETVIGAGRTGWLRLWGTSDIGLLGSVINFNGSAGTSNFNQGHNLHKLTLTSASLTIPIIPPAC